MDFAEKLVFDTWMIQSQLREDLGEENSRQKEQPVKKGVGVLRAKRKLLLLLLLGRFSRVRFCATP